MKSNRISIWVSEAKKTAKGTILECGNYGYAIGFELLAEGVCIIAR